jgi:hypothetical protein
MRRPWLSRYHLPKGASAGGGTASPRGESVENLEAIAPFAAGPASAVLVMLLVLAAIYKLVSLVECNEEFHKQNREDHQAIIHALVDLEKTISRPNSAA